MGIVALSAVASTGWKKDAETDKKVASCAGGGWVQQEWGSLRRSG